MCHSSVINFGKLVLNFENCYKKDILEIGAKDVNGSLRPHIQQFRPASYLGIDIEGGKNVDMILSVTELTKNLGHEKADLIICTEVMEHVENWKEAILQMKLFLKIGGYILLTTRSKGFPKHEFPGDYWRYSTDDLKKIFLDFEIERIAEDGQAPGVFIFAKKIKHEIELDNTIQLYSMMEGK